MYEHFHRLSELESLLDLKKKLSGNNKNKIYDIHIVTENLGHTKVWFLEISFSYIIFKLLKEIVTYCFRKAVSHLV